MGRTRGEFERSSANRAMERSISAWHTSKNTYPCYEVVELIWFIYLKDRDWNGQVQKIYYLFLSIITYSCLFLSILSCSHLLLSIYLFLQSILHVWILHIFTYIHTYIHTYAFMNLWVFPSQFHLYFDVFIFCWDVLEDNAPVAAEGGQKTNTMSQTNEITGHCQNHTLHIWISVRICKTWFSQESPILRRNFHVTFREWRSAKNSEDQVHWAMVETCWDNHPKITVILLIKTWIHLWIWKLLI